MTEIFNSIVRDLSHKGLGVIDHPDGRTFFARGTWPGDEGDFEIPLNALKYSEAKLLRIINPSPDRVEVACPHRDWGPGKCGGCPWMMASYSSQLAFKIKRLEHGLAKRGVFPDAGIMKSVIPSEDVFGYRNRIQLKSNGTEVGYVSEGSSVFAPVENCLILNKELEILFHSLKKSLPRDDLKPTGDHKWTYVDLDDEMTLSDIIPNKRRPFRQGNTGQNEKMKMWIRDKFNSLPRHYPVIDLFCGSGNFTEVLSEMGFTNILAVEVQGSAIDKLKGKNLPGVRILPLDMTQRGVWAQIAKYQPHARAILLDPPREGVEKRRGLFKYLDNLEFIAYISCEQDTFSRDTADIIKNGWSLMEISPIDLFPHTPHIEIMSIFARPSSS